jgi:predicted transcriptional regulator/transposase-like protein
MPRRLIDLAATPLLDIASYARRGPGRRDRLSQDEIELISRTVRRTPEVMVKVLSRGGRDLKAVGCHLAYLNRGGDVEIETDDGQTLSGKGVEEELLEDWDLDLEEHRRKADLEPRPSRAPPKLVHKLMFSMPAGTPPDKVLAAVKNFSREEFALKHRYAMVLHTDEPHPHVHMVVKAVSEQGVRLNIRKSTLRGWRKQFARHLRALGVAANATDRAVRGQTRSPQYDGVYRAEHRGESRRNQARVEGVAIELSNGNLRLEAGKGTLLQTRNKVERGWWAVSDILVAEGQPALATQVRRFLAEMPASRTDRELIAEALKSHRHDRRTPQDYPLR